MKCVMFKVRRAFATAGLILALAAPAAAQPDANFPNKPIRIVVSVAAGGGVDLSARILANHLQTLWGQPVTVENRTGGSSNIAGEAVWRAAPDGYTLLATPPNTLTANSALFSKLNYDPATFEPVAIMALGANILAVKNDSPVKTVPQLIAHAKANKLSYASQGTGSTSHLTFELFKSRTGIQVTHVPYKGAAPALIDIIAGHVPIGLTAPTTAIPHVKAGRLRALAVTAAQRSGAMPDVPTVAESGAPGFDIVQWYAIWLPAKTPKDIAGKLHGEIVSIIQSPDYKTRQLEVATDVVGSSPEALRELQITEIAKYRKIAASAGITPE
jgi:tripartite-type tricarboxylate transporter receptor subunit TctC